MKFDFDEPLDRCGTSTEKWAMYEKNGILPFWLADMDFRSPPAVIEALRARVDHGVFGYTRPPGELVETVVRTLEHDYGWPVDPEWLVWLPGVASGLNACCRVRGREGDGVLTATPVYPPFLSAPGNGGRSLVTVPLLQESGEWRLDIEALDTAAAQSRSRVFLLCNPHNPVGRVYSREELLALARLCEERDLIICSDEIHCGLVLDKDKAHIPTATLGASIAERTITLMAPSKTYNLPGLGTAFAVISNSDLRRDFRRVIAGLTPSPNALGYTAALAAYRDGGEWLAQLLDYLRRNRDIVMDWTRSLEGLSMAHVEATYLAWIDTRAVGLNDPAAFFETFGVGLGSGEAFGGPGFVRLTFGCQRSMLLKGLELMEKALATLRS